MTKGAIRFDLLTTRLLAAFFLVGVLPVGTVGLLANREGEATLRTQFFNHLASVAELKSQQLEGWVKERRHDVVRPASIPNVRRLASILTADPSPPKRPAAAAELREIFNRIRTLSGFAEMFLLGARDGEVLLSTDPEQEGKFKSDRPYFREGLRGPFVQHVYYSLVHGNVGAAFRQRAQIFVLLFIFASLGTYVKTCRRRGIDSNLLLERGAS